MGRYEVEFIAEYFVMSVTVDADNGVSAATIAAKIINDNYGFDVAKVSNQVEVNKFL